MSSPYLSLYTSFMKFSIFWKATNHGEQFLKKFRGVDRGLKLLVLLIVRFLFITYAKIELSLLNFVLRTVFLISFLVSLGRPINLLHIMVDKYRGGKFYTI